MYDAYDPLLNLPSPAVIALVPGWLAHKAQVLPMRWEDDVLVLATIDPEAFEFERLDELRFRLNCDIRLVAAPQSALAFALWRCYGLPATDV